MQTSATNDLTNTAALTNAELADHLKTMQPADIAEVLHAQSDGVQFLRVFRLLAKDLAVEVFAYLDADAQERLLRAFTDKELAQLVADLFTDDAVEVLEEMPASVVKRILHNVDEETRQTLNTILNYPVNSAGRVMTNELVSLKSEMTVKQAFGKIKSVGEDIESIYTCFVTDQNRILLGIVSVKTLLLSDLNAKLESIMAREFVCAKTTDDQEDCSRRMRKYDLIAMPVVDSENRLVGVLTVDDIVDIMEQEYTEDIQRMSALAPSDRNYMDMGILAMVRQRLGWLSFLMVSAFLTAIIITFFEDKLAACTMLLYSVPMLMGMGGNSGAQASTMAIRGLIVGEIRGKDMPKVILKELRVGLLVGILLLPLPFARVYLASGGADLTSFQVAMVACATSLSLVMIATVSKCLGCTLPFVAKRLKLDPAVMASPLVATIMDSLTLLLYFGMASALVFGLGGVAA